MSTMKFIPVRSVRLQLTSMMSFLLQLLSDMNRFLTETLTLIKKCLKKSFNLAKNCFQKQFQACMKGSSKLLQIRSSIIQN